MQAILQAETIANSSTLPLATTPISAEPLFATRELQCPTLRRLGNQCNRLCAVQSEACAYFLAGKGVLHRLAVTPQGGRVDAAPTCLPCWPAPSSGALATLVEIRNSPDVDDPPCLLASDGKNQLYVCDDGGDTIGGAPIPLPLPPGNTAAEGWIDWLLLDASWSRRGSRALCAAGVPNCGPAPWVRPEHTCSPHAHVHDWRDNDDARTARGLLHDVGVVPELGHVCLARPQRRFVVLSPRRRYCVVAEGKLVTVFALADVRGGSGAWLPSQQVCELEAGLGELLGVTVLEQPSNGQQLAIAEQSCPGCPGCAPRSADLCAPCVRPACVPPPQGEGVLLMLGSTGVSAMQLLAPSGRQLLESEQVTSGGVDKPTQQAKTNKYDDRAMATDAMKSREIHSLIGI